MVYHTNYDALRDPRLLQEVGDLNNRNPREMYWAEKLTFQAQRLKSYHKFTTSLSPLSSLSPFPHPRSTLNSQQSTVNGQQPTVNSQQSTVNSQQSTVNSQQPLLVFMQFRRALAYTFGLSIVDKTLLVFLLCNHVLSTLQTIYKQDAIEVVIFVLKNPRYKIG
ncbi:transcriptional-repair coupling factor [Calothrix sp. NIES-2100]|nr:transcriptional-repair coupling factor [Calothrix sp. NIES-2100]